MNLLLPYIEAIAGEGAWNGLLAVLGDGSVRKALEHLVSQIIAILIGL